MNPSRICIPLVFILGVVFQLATVTDGHSWGDDFAQYILHARNIARGIPYAQTGYLYSDHDFMAVNVGPKAYPPLTALALVPVHRVFGLSFRAMKMEMAVILVLSVLVILVYFRPRLTHLQQVVLAVAILFNPVLFGYKDSIGSDYLFLLLCFVALILMEKLAGGPKSLWPALALGFVLYLAYAARTVGVILAPALVLYMFLRRKEGLKYALVACLVFGGLAAIQSAWVPPDESYARVFRARFSWSAVFANWLAYFKDTSILWENGFNETARKGVYLLSVPLCVFGVWSAARRSVSAIEIFLLFYVPAVLLYPSNQGLRFLIPCVPAYFYYLLIGAGAVPRSVPLGRHLTSILAGTIVASYSGAYLKMDFEPDRTGVTRPTFLELCNFVKSNSDLADRFIFRKPRAFALMAERPASIYAFTQDSDRMWQFVRDVGAKYLVVADLPERDFATDRSILLPFVTRNREAFDRVFTNENFAVYRLKPLTGGP